MSDLLASSGLALSSQTSPLQLSDWHDKAFHKTALVVPLQHETESGSIRGGLRVEPDGTRAATEYENSRAVDLPRGTFDLPPDADLRFHKFLRTYHIRAVTKDPVPTVPSPAPAPAPETEPGSLDAYTERVRMMRERRRAKEETRAAAKRVRTPKWMHMTTVTDYY